MDISRDNLTYIGREWITNTLLSKLLPKIIELISDIFIQELGATPQIETIDIQYLNYSLTAYAYQKQIYDKSILSKIKIPHEIASYDKSEITAEKLLEATTLLLVNGFKTNGTNSIVQSEIERIEKQYNDVLSGYIIIWGGDYLYNSLMFNYICSEVLQYDNNCKIYKLQKITSSSFEYKPIRFNKNYLNILDYMGVHKCSRKTIYGLDEYPNISVRKYYISGFENFPQYSSCCIYSPFTNKSEIEDLLNNL